MAITISMRQMLEAGVHFGHKKRFWNPKMAPYIYGEREKLHIIDLEKSLPRFRALLEFFAQLTAKRGKVLFVGTKYAARDIVREEAIRCGMPYVDHRWLGGMLTNYKTIRKSIRRLKELEMLLGNPKALMGLTKKEVLTLQREQDKLAHNLEGIKNMGGLPDALFVIDVKQEKTAIQEANRLGIPVAGIVDTNTTPEGVDYMVPGNDDAMRAIRFYCKTVADLIIESRRTILEEDARKEKEKAEKVRSKAPKVKTAKTVARPIAKKKITKATDQQAAPVVKKSASEDRPVSAAKKTFAKPAKTKKMSTEKILAKKQEAKSTTKKTVAKKS